MNITFQTTKNSTAYRSTVPAQPRKAAVAGPAKGDYDTVKISRSRIAKEDDESFARLLARRTAASLGNGASQEKVQELSRRVADGTYQPDAQRIAGRMLGLG